MFQPFRLNARNPGPMTGSGNNTYLLIHPGRQAALIDAGVGEPRHIAAIDEHLREAGARLARVLVTHAHSDHASGVSALAVACQEAVFEKFPWPEKDAAYGVTWRQLRDGDRLTAAGEVLTVLHTPGHSPDHIVLWHEESGTLLSGDLVVPGRSVAISWSSGGRVDEYLASLERVLALKPRRLLPAHGAEVTEPTELLLAFLDHRRHRERQVIDALAAGRDSVPSIAESIYDGLEPALMPIARETVRAHLEKLRSEGRAFEEHGRWWM